MTFDSSDPNAGGSDKRRIFTIGHSNTSVEDLVADLGANGIRVLVDVRRYPSSKRHPQFNRPALAFALQMAGIAYVHEVDLGGHREPAVDSPNGGLKKEGFRAYVDHMATEPFGRALGRIQGAASRMPLALMCAEADPAGCHRFYLSDRLTTEGFEVIHLIRGGGRRTHRLSPEARIVDDRLIYPPDGGQGTLF